MIERLFVTVVFVCFGHLLCIPKTKPSSTLHIAMAWRVSRHYTVSLLQNERDSTQLSHQDLLLESITLPKPFSPWSMLQIDQKERLPPYFKNDKKLQKVRRKYIISHLIDMEQPSKIPSNCSGLSMIGNVIDSSKRFKMRRQFRAIATIIANQLISLGVRTHSVDRAWFCIENSVILAIRLMQIRTQRVSCSHTTWIFSTIGIGMIVVGTCLIVYALKNYLDSNKTIASGRYMPKNAIVYTASATIIGLGVIMIIFLVGQLL